MNCLLPSYYSAFACIKERCRHNCCIGWEIDIDEKTFCRYQEAEGEFGDRLRDGIAIIDGTPVFRLGEGERCPFLNDSNLCDIILNLGENQLCQICSDHPRFVNFFSDRQEWGLGLCCEAAAELIVRWKEPVMFQEKTPFETEWQEAEEAVFFCTREEILELLQDRSQPVAKRMQGVMKRWKIQLPAWDFSKWKEILLQMERLDPEWEKVLNRLPVHSEEKVWQEEWEVAWEQLLVYFIYRHLAESVYDGRFGARLAFSIQSVLLLQELCREKETTALEDLIELARQYSAEIEYSEENMEEMLTLLQQ